jgi:hypothetical protein
MKIACLGWGSLIWRPEKLLIHNTWFEDGPILPIEFTRQSDNGRITLIIDKEAIPVTTLWALMATDNLQTAINSLKEREEVQNDNLIHFVKATHETNDEIKSIIIDWLKSKKLDAAIWTGLSFSKHTNYQQPTIEYVIRHLKSLEGEAKALAEEYIRKAPKQVDTEYRQKIQSELGWTFLEE